MKAATAKQIRDELKDKSQKDLQTLCLRLSRFKKENKELLTYLLFEAGDEASYINSVAEEMEASFASINRGGYYLIKKGIRKILQNTKKHIRYSGIAATEVSLLLHFCRQMKAFHPPVRRNTVLANMYNRQLALVEKKIATLHEELQYDFGLELAELFDI